MHTWLPCRGCWDQSAFPVFATQLNSSIVCRRYDKANKPLSAFEADIEKYKQVAEEVLGENARESVRFMSIDATPLQKVKGSFLI